VHEGQMEVDMNLTLTPVFKTHEAPEKVADISHSVLITKSCPFRVREMFRSVLSCFSPELLVLLDFLGFDSQRSLSLWMHDDASARMRSRAAKVCTEHLEGPPLQPCYESFCEDGDALSRRPQLREPRQHTTGRFGIWNMDRCEHGNVWSVFCVC